MYSHLVVNLFQAEKCVFSTTHASCILTEINIFLFLYYPYIIQNMHCNMFNQTPFWRFPR